MDQAELVTIEQVFASRSPQFPSQQSGQRTVVNRAAARFTRRVTRSTHATSSTSPLALTKSAVICVRDFARLGRRDHKPRNCGKFGKAML